MMSVGISWIATRLLRANEAMIEDLRDGRQFSGCQNVICEDANMLVFTQERPVGDERAILEEGAARRHCVPVGWTVLKDVYQQNGCNDSSTRLSIVRTQAFLNLL